MNKLIIIPAYNEEENIVKVITEIEKNDLGFDYIIINDCSKDNTLKICKDNNFNVIKLPINLGIGGAMQAGYIYALRNNYDIAIQIDGDGQHDPSYIKSLVKPIELGQADLIIGSRFIEKEGFQSSFMRRIGINYFNMLLKLFTGIRITDPTSGFRACNKTIISYFANNYPKDYPEPESIMTLLKEGFRIIEIPVKMKERVGGQSSIRLLKSIYYMIKVTLAILIAREKSTKRFRLKENDCP